MATNMHVALARHPEPTNNNCRLSKSSPKHASGNELYPTSYANLSNSAREEPFRASTPLYIAVEPLTTPIPTPPIQSISSKKRLPS
jgi:hypothetical protein